MADEDDIKPVAADAAADGDGIAEAADTADAPPREPDEDEVAEEVAAVAEDTPPEAGEDPAAVEAGDQAENEVCLLYTSPSPRD